MNGCRWTTLDELAGRREEWQELLSGCPFPNGFADPAWVLGWWGCYGEGREPWCLVSEDGSGRLTGVAVLALSSSALARTLRFAGDAWNGLDTVVCAAGSEAEFASALLAELATRRRQWDVWRVRRLPRATELARLLLEGPGALRASATDVRGQPFIELPASVEEFDARFAGKTRNTQRRKAKRLAALGTEIRLIDDPAEAEGALATLLELRRQRAMEQRQSHDMDARFERFLVAAVRRMLPAAARLWTLELEGRTLAMRLNLVAGSREHSYLLGLSDEHRNLSPGAVLERHAIDDAIAQGRTEFDLGPGRDDYKYRLGGIDREVSRLVVLSGSSRARISGTAATLDVRLRSTPAAEAIRRRRGIAPSV